MAKANPLEALKANQASARKWAQEVGVARVKRLMQKAQRDLNKRLVEGVALSAASGRETFTEAHLRATLAQVEHVLRTLKPVFKEAIVRTGKETIEPAVKNTVDYLRAADSKFKGVGTAPLAIDEASMLDVATKGTEASILRRIASDPTHPRQGGILDRYGNGVISSFEETLQLRFLGKQPWDVARQALIEDSPFLKSSPLFWAERIIRTETMSAHNRASWESINQAQEDDGGMLKILAATFDDRTGADSYAVHGQIRRPAEAFESWFGLYQAPPNRPNDREDVVPHNMRWEIPGYLKWKSDAQISARWAAEGRKGGPPGRPLMTTVPLDKIGVAG